MIKRERKEKEGMVERLGEIRKRRRERIEKGSREKIEKERGKRELRKQFEEEEEEHHCLLFSFLKALWYPSEDTSSLIDSAKALQQ